MKTRMDFMQIKKFLFAAGFKVSEKNPLEKVMAQYADEYELNPHDFTEANLRSWGCRNWDGETILLSPWMVQFLPQGFTLYDINDGTVEVGKDEINMDTRAGVIAFGVKFADLKQEEVKQDKLEEVKQSVIDKLEKITGQKIDGISFE
jgi:hypothetical protein